MTYPDKMPEKLKRDLEDMSHTDHPPTIVFDPELQVFRTANGDQFSAQLLANLSETPAGTWAQIQRDAQGSLVVYLVKLPPYFREGIIPLAAGLVLGMCFGLWLGVHLS